MKRVDAASTRLALNGPFSRYVKAFAVMIASLAFGLFATYASLHAGHGFAGVRAGPWAAWPRNGTMQIDPYARAVLARSGETPLGREEGLVFFARADSDGFALDGRCEYRIVSPTPPARFWTLGATRLDGGLIATPAERYGFTSSDVLRYGEGAFEIVIAREARPGNWLPVGDGPFSLALRLYDTPLDTDAALDPAAFPRIAKAGCA